MKGVKKETSASSDLKKRKKEESAGWKIEDYTANFTSAKGSSKLWDVPCKHCGKWVKKANVMDDSDFQAGSSYSSQFEPP